MRLVIIARERVCNNDHNSKQLGVLRPVNHYGYIGAMIIIVLMIIVVMVMHLGSMLMIMIMVIMM